MGIPLMAQPCSWPDVRPAHAGTFAPSLAPVNACQIIVVVLLSRGTGTHLARSKLPQGHEDCFTKAGTCTCLVIQRGILSSRSQGACVISYHHDPPTCPSPALTRLCSTSSRKSPRCGCSSLLT